MDIKNAQKDAEASFKRKEIQLAEGGKAWAEYKASAAAVTDKIARLRALRLAREAVGGSRAQTASARRRCSSR